MDPSTDQLEVIIKHLIALCVIKNGFDVGDEDVVTEIAQRLQFDLGIAKLLEQRVDKLETKQRGPDSF